MEGEADGSDSAADVSALGKKHLAMLERLSNRHQSRPDKSGSPPPAASFESTSSFLSLFNESRMSIESRLAQCRLADRSLLQLNFDEISASIANLEKLVAESSYYLPPYEVRSSLKTISDLKQALDNLSSELIPKKKFSFKNKPARKEPTAPSSKGAEADGHGSRPAAKAGSLAVAVPDSPGFRNRANEVLAKDVRGLEVGEFTLSDLESCEVRLIGCTRALFVHRLRNCRVYAGPVTGSVLIEEAEDCVFLLASHQIRIHNAKASDFYLRVRSRPIIEDCTGARFAPYRLNYRGIEQDLEDAALGEETGNWSKVDDFKWLRAAQSPNWSVLPENERIGTVDISELSA
ncbi:tubulin-folding cofactor C [Rhodamnia argentea]|uniref:Tubulin-folding cofactor C n=1 Tax=Rhodamnia argentea TaxID=178133 RepID=A0A8B8NDZ6_9MYRT|nr:tubulin-folding cofactor C [Rhodamnia argentea]